MIIVLIIIALLLLVLIYQVGYFGKRVEEEFQRRNFLDYPVYSREELEKELQEAVELQQKHFSLPKNTSNYKSEDELREAIKTAVEAEFAWKKIKFMIEGNAAVSSGRKTINEIEEKWEQEIMGFDIDAEVDRRLRLKTKNKKRG